MYYLFLIIIETILVGIYSFFIGSILFPLKINRFLFLFLTGFFKHYFAGICNIHKLYCKNKMSTQFKFSYKELFYESIIEGILFIIIGYFLFSNLYDLIFIGIILHISFEIFGLHNKFCSFKNK